jgi:hypothetical protein
LRRYSTQADRQIKPAFFFVALSTYEQSAYILIVICNDRPTGKMAAKRKQRTRNHVIADLSVNHVAHRILKAGFSMEVFSHDYGYDGFIAFYDTNGEIENSNAYIQLKATDFIAKATIKNAYSFSIKKKDFDLWCDAPFPVYLVLFDAIGEQAYWVYFQKYCELNKISAASIKGASLKVHIDSSSVFDFATPKQWQADAQNIMNQLKGVIKHA